MTRYAIFVHDPDGDMGYGRIVGPFTNIDTAERKADKIRNASTYQELECIILPVLPGRTPATTILDEVDQ